MICRQCTNYYAGYIGSMEEPPEDSACRLDETIDVYEVEECENYSCKTTRLHDLIKIKKENEI